MEPQGHTHQDPSKLKGCYLGRRVAFEASRRVEWQLALRGLRLSKAEEPCQKCGCFWTGHDKEQCRGVGSHEDNLWAVHNQYCPELLRLLKEITQMQGAGDNTLCPLCDDEEKHDWLECVWMARYNPLELLDCEVTMRPPLGPSEVTRLQADLFLWVEDDADGNPVLKSRIPPCRFCN